MVIDQNKSGGLSTRINTIDMRRGDGDITGDTRLSSTLINSRSELTRLFPSMA